MSKEKNAEEAAELYVKAAAQFKISKDFMQAGLAYEKAAQCNMIANNEIESNSNWRESGKCYRHVDTNKAISSYRNAIEFFFE
jgi:alpha-soluble NSF attachment protein